MRIALRCLPGYADYLPQPVLARTALPDWLRTMPAEAAAPLLADAQVRTVKQCPPFVDAMQGGILFPLAADLTVEDGVLSWDWDLPPHASARPSRAPVGALQLETGVNYGLEYVESTQATSHLIGASLGLRL